jgi:hypothetical protein
MVEQIHKEGQQERVAPYTPPEPGHLEHRPLFTYLEQQQQLARTAWLAGKLAVGKGEVAFPD